MQAEDAQGEDDLIETTFAPLASGFPGALGLKDDCAVLRPAPGEDLVLTTDAVASGVHFFEDDDPADIAWKALAVNVSDLAAKGARPIAYLLSLSFPERPANLWLEGFARGLGEAQAAFGIELAGGDTDRRPGPLSATITAIGGVPKGRMVRRATARAGDLLFVSGTIGDSALGLMLRQDAGQAATLGLQDDDVRALLGRYLRPAPRLGLAVPLLSFAKAAMDISDGLLKDCGRMARASGLRAELDGRLVPFSEALQRVLALQPDYFGRAVAGGDDYEVLAAVGPEDADAFRAFSKGSGVEVTQIGKLGEGAGISIVGLDGKVFVPQVTGWDHFPDGA